MNYQGWALFMDCDMFMGDIAELWRLRDDKYMYKFVNMIIHQRVK